MNFSQADIHNLQMLKKAFGNLDVALIECQLVATGKVIPVICAVNRRPPGRFELVPVAQLFRGDPYCLVNPPREDGSGFFTQAEQRGELN